MFNANDRYVLGDNRFYPERCPKYISGMMFIDEDGYTDYLIDEYKEEG